MIKKILFLLSVCFFIPLFALGESITENTLKKEFGLFLDHDKISIPWSEKEADFLLRFLSELPESLTRKRENIRLKKIRKSYLSYLNGECCEEFGKILIFSKEEVQKTIGKLKGKEVKELSSFLIDNGLIVSREDPEKLYLSYLARNVIMRFLIRYDKKFKISGLKEWKKLSGWGRKSLLKIPLPLAGMEAENVHLKGFAHPLGRKKPDLDFATFGASFFAPPKSVYADSVKCMLPKKYSFFTSLFPGHLPYLNNPEYKKHGISCSDDNVLSSFEFQDIHTGEKIEMGPVNFETVEGFELIYATPGDREISEIAGHLMLRIKLRNNPDNKDEENPYDLIIAVLADNKEIIDNNVKTKSDKDPCSNENTKESIQFHELFSSTYEAVLGLTGGFRTIFQIDTFQYAVDHYTTIGNRTLERFELILNDNQKISLINHLKESLKNYKTNYYFFNRNCGSILTKLIGEALNDEDIASYNTFIAPPNSLLSDLMKRVIIKPTLPKIYSYTSKAQIASDIIWEKITGLEEKYDISFPSYRNLNSNSEDKRINAYSELYKIALKRKEITREITEIFKLAQISELAYTWNKGLCIQYSTKTKGVIRSFIEELEKNSERKVDIARLVRTYNLKKEKEDYSKGTSHTGLSPFKTGYEIKYTENSRDESYFYISSSLYSQEMGDISNMSLLRGTEVKLGSFEFDASRNDKGYRVTALKIRKIKERRDYVPSVFSVNRKFGFGFTLLNFDNPPDSDNLYMVKPGEIEGFVSLCSSRLFLDYIIAGMGLSLETEAEEDKFPLTILFNNTTSMGFPLRLEGQFTLGDSRFMKINLDLEYKPYLLISGDNSYNGRESTFSFNSSVNFRLGEYFDTELLLNTSYSRITLKREDNKETTEETVRLGLTFLLW